MNKLIFKKIYLFSTIEKKARCLQFSDGINVISSSQVDGTDRGKSVVMRSLYHSLGADSQFDDKWDDNNKIYVLMFSINDDDFYIYRNKKLFKFFDSEKNLLFSTVNRHELAEQLNHFFHFSVQLPNRSEDKLEITPPVYNYLLYFIDQDHYSGTTFASFSGLMQYEKYKENVIYYHLGVFDENYFNIVKQLEKLSDLQKQIEKKQSLLEGMLEKIDSELKGSTYSYDLSILKADVEKTKIEYSSIVTSLNKVKQQIISMKNQRFELELALSELKKVNAETEKEIKSLNGHTCPLCKTNLSDTVELRAKKYNSSSDIILLSNDVQQSILRMDIKISLESDKYKEHLSVLNEYEKRLSINTEQVNDVLKHKGYIEVRDSLLKEFNELKKTFEETLIKIDEFNKQRKGYDETKKTINNLYYTLLLNDKTEFGLSEIDDKRFENIRRTFTASGSNKPIATVMWYSNLIKLKNQFNPSAIKFPVVFDSPNNAETDDIKRHELLAYLLNNATEYNQLIISSIGFDVNNFIRGKDCNIIELTNNKYQLLIHDEYELYCDLLFELSKK